MLEPKSCATLTTCDSYNFTIMCFFSETSHLSVELCEKCSRYFFLLVFYKTLQNKL